MSLNFKTTMSLSQLMSYRERLIKFRNSLEIQEIDFKWRCRLNEEIEDLDNEINPVTIKDFSNKK